jgi:hypothetical protein
MTLLVLGGIALATLFVSLWRAIAADAYGLRPPPRSRHDEEEFDSRGLPIKRIGPH